MDSFKRLVYEIHRRSLWQVLGIYTVGAWVALQAVDLLTNAGGLPSWFPTFALALLIIGLPIVLATAFVQEGGPGSQGTEESWGTEGLRSEYPPAFASRGAAPGDPGSRVKSLFTWRNAILGGVAVFAFWGVVAAGWIVLHGVSPEREPEVVEADVGIPADSGGHRGSVAVLPFDNLGDPSDDFLSDGLTEEVIAQLAQVPELKVISRTSVLALRGAALTLPQIADTLRVEHVLEGTVRRVGDRARITVQLIEAESDAHLWARSYTRSLLDLFAVQEEIAREVSRALVQAVPDLRPLGGASRTDQAYAYETFLRGRQLLHRRTREALLGAMEAFERTINADSVFAPAYAHLSAAYGLWVTYGYTEGPDPYPAYGRAIVLADQAIELDPGNAVAYSARAYVLTRAWAPSAAVEADFLRAIELQPSSADAHGWYAHLLAREERDEESLAAARRAIELDPISPGRRWGYAVDAFGARRYEEAYREARQARILEPELLAPRATEGLAALLMGRPEECLSAMPELYPALKATCLHSLDRRDEAEREVDRIARLLDLDGPVQGDVDRATLLSDMVVYYAWTGQAAHASRWLERTFEASPQGVNFRYIRSGLFDPIRDDADFSGTLRRSRMAAWERVSREKSLHGGP